MEKISIQIYSGDGVNGEISISSTGGLEHIYIAVPTSEEIYKNLEDMISSSGGVYFNTFAYFRKKRGLTSEILSRNIPGNSPVIEIPMEGDSPTTQSLKMSDVSKLGKLLTIILSKQGNIVGRTDIPLINSE